MINTRARGFASPGMYVQGPGEYANFPAYTAVWGKRPFFLIDGFLFTDIKTRLSAVYQGTGFSAESFGGECTETEIDRVAALLRQNNADVCVAVGGGKTLDTGKSVAIRADLPLIIAPTSAATDAPCSAMSVLYSEEHEYLGCVFHPKHAELVLVDTEIVAAAPLRLFKAGMGDAMSTFYEVLANEAAGGANYVGRGYRSTKAAIALARLARDILLTDGYKAVSALENGAVTEAVENVVEANILLGGQFENGGSSVAHAVHGALTALPQTHRFLHGEKVAFGIVVQLLLENRPDREIEEIVTWLAGLDLPVTLSRLDIEPSDANISYLAERITAPNSRALVEPFCVTPQSVAAVLKAAEAVPFIFSRQKAWRSAVSRSDSGA
ncbi:MAG: glycerol dehydrogenase [Gracilibacteraceae bacterium]|nr:glycerol dehydrogenase [Gracilibacteraceae bacterium]